MADELTVRLEGVAEMRRVLRSLPKKAEDEARRISAQIAKDEVGRIVSAARRQGRQARLAAKSVQVKRSRIPAIEAGGSRSVRGGVSGSDVFFGSEFGGQGRPRTMQFPPFKYQEGYFFWPTLRNDFPRMIEEYGGAIEAMAQEWQD